MSLDSAWFRSTFLGVLKFLHIKKGWPNFSGEPILQKVSIICSPVLYFNLKSFMDRNSSSFVRFQCILHNSGLLLSETWNFYKLKRGDLISGGNQFFRKCELFGLPFYISILKGLWTQFLRRSLDFNRFCMIQEYFSGVLNFCKFKSGDLISLERGNQFCSKSELSGPAFFISILKISTTHILCHLLDFNLFCMIQKSVCETFASSTN